MRMIALFTTIPANAMIPTPVLIMPKGIRKIVRPMRTPIVDMTTEVRMITGFTTELNWLIRMKPISRRAVRKAPVRNSVASSCSWDWPVYRIVKPGGKADSKSANTSWTSPRTALFEYPAATSDVIVTIRSWFLRRIVPAPSSTFHVATESSGTWMPPSAMTVSSRRPSSSSR